MNLYAYVENDPVNTIDPWGLQSFKSISEYLETLEDAAGDPNIGYIRMGAGFQHQMGYNPPHHQLRINWTNILNAPYGKLVVGCWHVVEGVGTAAVSITLPIGAGIAASPAGPVAAGAAFISVGLTASPAFFLGGIAFTYIGWKKINEFKDYFDDFPAYEFVEK
jgi:hypothetical protein